MPNKFITRLSTALAALLIGCTVPAAAALKVFACEPEWGALAQEIGGDKLDVYTATTALQDPHQIQARPSLIAKVRNADMLVCTGAELENWLGMKEVAVLEPKPGIPPSSSYLAEVLDHLKQQPAKMVIRSAYQEGRPSEWLSQQAHIPAVELPFTVGGDDQAKDLFGLFDDTVQRLLKAIQ